MRKNLAEQIFERECVSLKEAAVIFKKMAKVGIEAGIAGRNLRKKFIEAKKGEEE